MSKEFLKSNSISLRACVLYHFEVKKPIFEIFKEFSKVVGIEMMNYPEFEFWFRRFENGNFDLTYDRSLEPEKPTIFDLPDETLQQIVQKANLKEVSILRQVSAKFRSIVEKTDLFIKDAHLTIQNEGISLEINDKKLTSDVYWDYNGDYDFILPGPGADAIIQQIECYLNHPKLNFDRFHVGIYATFEMDEVFQKIGSHVTSAYFENSSILANHIKWFQPGKLKDIHLGQYHFDRTICNSDQWKEAKNLFSEGSIEGLKAEDLSHFERFEIECMEWKKGELAELRIDLLESPVFKYCRLNFYSDLTSEKMDSLEKELGRHAERTYIDEEYRHYYIEKGGKTFEIKMEKSLISIERKF